MNVGRIKKGGWVIKVLRIFECHIETRAVMRPGKRTTADVRKVVSPILLVAYST